MAIDSEVDKISGGEMYALLISLIWSTTVGVLGYDEERVWNSFFLQYLWEFCLGMRLAEIYMKSPETLLNVPKWKYLIPICILGILLTGITGWMGFPWKLYNDMPSLFGYTSLALIIYKLGINPINRFFSYTNRFSYEWYLVHILVFWIVKYIIREAYNVPVIVEIFICLFMSYLTAMGYASLWKKRKIKIWKQ